MVSFEESAMHSSACVKKTVKGVFASQLELTKRLLPASSSTGPLSATSAAVGVMVCTPVHGLNIGVIVERNQQQVTKVALAAA